MWIFNAIKHFYYLQRSEFVVSLKKKKKKRNGDQIIFVKVASKAKTFFRYWMIHSFYFKVLLCLT